jgi:hypothetical protein
MDEFLLGFLNDDDYRNKIEYNKKIKELNNILDKILYLCNNFSYKRIKYLYINIIEHYNYYDDDDRYSNFDKYIKDPEKLIDTKETNDSDKAIKKTHKEINKQIENFKDKYNEFSMLEYDKKDNIKNFQDQNNYLINKLDNIISTLNILDKDDDKDDIYFNIQLINKKSILYNILGYSILKNGLLKNVHINDDDLESISEKKEKENLKKINNKLINIYNKNFNFLLKMRKEEIEGKKGIKEKIEELKEIINNVETEEYIQTATVVNSKE